ncbi:uncharacterized protein DNG_10012 [Cephalotrichum gorgonifer]|uniref:Mitochondrial adapter protein MCP1 transmembrane domain-containing protein n=1 Tax=Cephalotrichum gorgonifer TaxID=2041049 RepID=A0AAE8SZY2_9PEZI|nr:uncharacterized protein DNG_10012 [Cephalotrichum gorgonifer]
MATPASLHPKPSEETLASLLQLDPTPIVESPAASAADKPLPSLPDERADADPEKLLSERRGSGARRHRGTTGPISLLSRIQRYSSITFAVFTSIHLANTSIIPLITCSVPASETYLLLTRELYQTSSAEPLLVAVPALAHVCSGVALRLLRRSQNASRYANDGAASSSSTVTVRLWPAVSWISASGYTFAASLAAHVAMNRVVPLLVEGDSSNIGLAYVAHGFARHPAVSTVAYVGLLAAGCGHMVWGAAKWLGIAPPSPSADGQYIIDARTRSSRRKMWLGIHAASVTFALVWAAGGLGVVARGGASPGWIGKLYDGLFGSVGL